MDYWNRLLEWPLRPWRGAKSIWGMHVCNGHAQQSRGSHEVVFGDSDSNCCQEFFSCAELLVGSLWIYVVGRCSSGSTAGARIADNVPLFSNRNTVNIRLAVRGQTATEYISWTGDVEFERGQPWCISCKGGKVSLLPVSFFLLFFLMCKLHSQFGGKTLIFIRYRYCETLCWCWVWEFCHLGCLCLINLVCTCAVNAFRTCLLFNCKEIASPVAMMTGSLLWPCIWLVSQATPFTERGRVWSYCNYQVVAKECNYQTVVR